MRFEDEAGSTRKGAEAEAEAKAEADDVPMALPCDVITCNSGRQCILADDFSVDPMCSSAECQRHGNAVATPAVKAGATALELAGRWLCDTGAAYDLVSGSVAKSGWDSVIDVKPVPFQTANGIHTTNKALQTETPGLGPAGLQAYVMHEDSPCALSVGQRCMNDGYSFVWIKGKKPCFILPVGEDDEGVAVLTTSR